MHSPDDLAADVARLFAAPRSHEPAWPPAAIALSDLERKAVIDARAA